VRQVVAWKLKRLGCRVLQAKDGEQALALIKTISKIDAILTDVIMPGMNGKELVKTIRKTHPHMSVIYMSGYPEDVITKNDILEPDVYYIEKSDLDEKLGSTLSRVLNDSLRRTAQE